MGVETRGGATTTIELIVKREIAVNGRGRVLINGSPLSVRELAEAMDAVLEIHGQSESHHRIAGQTFRELVDQYGEPRTLLAATRTSYRAWREAADQLRELSEAQRDRSLRLDLLKYQIDEISAATARSRRRGIAARRAKHARARARDDRGDRRRVQPRRRRRIVGADAARARGASAPAAGARDQRDRPDRLRARRCDLPPAGDLARTLQHLSDSVRHDPARLEAIEERLVTIERLNKKYGGSIAAVLDHLSRISDEFEKLNDFEGSIEKLQQVEAQSSGAYRKAAEKLSTARRKSAESFQKAIETELRDLAMERTTVRIAVDREERFGPDGFDQVEILVAPNRGEEPKAMQRIASGGELSRIQLAIAAALFKASGRAAAATLVFDEIDAGIGGRVAEVVGRKLRELSAANQVICVTHLPQIASFGSTHFYVWKEDAKGQTRARIRRLDSDDERVTEIARMLGGEKIAASAVAHARELLESARGKPAKSRA